MRLKRLVTLTLLVPMLSLGLLACTGDGDDGGDGDTGVTSREDDPDLPAAQGLLNSSADLMTQVRTVHFVLSSDGSVRGVRVKQADASLTREGDAGGTITIEQGGQLVELEFAMVGDQLTIQGPTGGVQRLPASFASTVYDPSLILDAGRGIPALLRGAREPTTVAEEDVAGTRAYRIEGTFPGDILGSLVPGLSADSPGTVWIGVDQPRLLQARFPVTDGSATVVLSDFDAPVTITPLN